MLRTNSALTAEKYCEVSILKRIHAIILLLEPKEPPLLELLPPFFIANVNFILSYFTLDECVLWSE